MSQFYVNFYGGQRYWSSKTPDPIKDKLTVYEHPMRTDTNSPKVPDGKATLSLGVKVQSVSTLIQQGGVMEMMMFPGINCGMCFNNAAHADPEVPMNNMIYSRHAGLIGVPVPNEKAWSNITPLNKEQQWRVVSQQVKLTSVNSAHDYDGWWECVRMTCIPSEFDMWTDREEDESGHPLSINNVYVGQDPSEATKAAAFPNVTTDLTINPTYCTGKVKDLHKYNFQLLPSVNNHDFLHLDDAATGRHLAPYIDDTFDCIYIRIHGTPMNTEVAGTRPTTIMAHLVSNQELIYRENTIMTRYHTECYDATTQLKAVRRRMHQYTKAAKPIYKLGV